MLLLPPCVSEAQCLSSVNPVGGTENILVLEKKSFRLISFYKYGEARQYYEGSRPSDFNLIGKAYYNYLTGIAGYGLSNKLTLEAEAGYYINKSQVYNTNPSYTLKGYGFSNLTVSAKFNLVANHVRRIYHSASLGLKIPLSLEPQWVDNVELPDEIQPTMGAFGIVFNSFLIRELPEQAWRFILTNRIETNFPNRQGYLPGTSVFSSFFLSKHLMFPWLKGDWTTILQLRNEIRMPDRINETEKPSSGSVLFFLSPQINYVLYEKWYISVLADFPVWQYFNGTQLGGGLGLTVSFSRTIDFRNKNQQL